MSFVHYSEEDAISSLISFNLLKIATILPFLSIGGTVACLDSSERVR